MQLITFKCSGIISVTQQIKHFGKLHCALHSQLEKIRGHECSSMGKLCSCNWHSAFMVSLEEAKHTKIHIPVNNYWLYGVLGSGHAV